MRLISKREQLDLLQLNMLKLLLLLLLISVRLSFIIQTLYDSNQVSTIGSLSSQNLKFPNRTGLCVNSYEVSDFIIYAQTAYSFHGDNIKNNLAYLHNQMEDKFASFSQDYIIFIQSNNKTNTQWSINSINNCYYASLNQINPFKLSWSYLFVRASVNKTSVYTYVGELGKGAGITSQIETYISVYVHFQERTSQCDCGNVYGITQAMNSATGDKWNIICDDSHDVNAYIFAKDDKWIYTRPKNCFYLMFAA